MAKKQSLKGFSEVTGRIQNVVTTEIFSTEFSPATMKDLRQANQQHDWSFNWNGFTDSFHVIKLTTLHNPTVLQGLVGFTVQKNYVFMDFVEVAPHNKGRGKIYKGVAGNLMAFVCYLSVLKGYEGFVVFEPKPQLTELYEQYGAMPLPKVPNLMYFSETVGQDLVFTYLNT